MGFFLSFFWVLGFFPVYTVHSAIVGVGKSSGFLLYSAKFVHSLDVISRAFYLGIWYSHSWWHLYAIHHGACTLQEKASHFLMHFFQYCSTIHNNNNLDLDFRGKVAGNPPFQTRHWLQHQPLNYYHVFLFMGLLRGRDLWWRWRVAGRCILWSILGTYFPDLVAFVSSVKICTSILLIELKP